MAITQRGTRLLASDPDYADEFGQATAISSNGLVMAVGAPNWDATYTNCGCVYIYDYTGGAWVQRGSVLQAPGVTVNDYLFGASVALSADGLVMAVGATYAGGGKVYIYDYTGGTWVQRGSAFSATNPNGVALSDDGTVLAFGSSSSYTVTVYDYSGGSWVYRSTTSAAFGGASVALSGDGSVMAIGAPKKSTAFTWDGCVYIYDWSGSWVLRGTALLPGDAVDYGGFGIGAALSTDGTVLAVGAYNYSGTSDYRGAVYLFDYVGGVWVARTKLTSTDSIVGFYYPALSADGLVMVVGGPTYDASFVNQGAVYTYDITLDNFVKAFTSLTVSLSQGFAEAFTALTVESNVTAYTSLTLVYPSGTATASTNLSVSSSGIASASAVLAVISSAHVSNWTARCLIDGVDVSASLEGVISVTADEGAARIASLAINPPSGTIAPLDYVGKTITLDYVPVIGGTPVPLRLFTGRIDTPQYDLNTRLLNLSCVDDLQNRVASLDRSVIDSLIGGRYCLAVQGGILDNWDYTEARLTTVAGSLDAGAHGGMRVTPWVLPTAWVTYGSGDLLYEQSILGSLPQRSTLINSVTVEFEYRYPRLRQRYTTLGWSGTQIDMRANGWAYPKQQDILGAAGGTGWTVTTGIFYPAPAAIPHLSGGFIYPDQGSIDMAILHLTQRHSQTVSESYTLAVNATESITANGELPYTLRGALESTFDGGAWESALDVAPLLPSGGELDYSPDATRADSDYAIQTLLDQANVKILGSHRGARLTNAVLCNPDLDLDKRITIATADMDVSGKVVSVNHVLNLLTGSATSEFSIACFGAGGAGILTPDSLDPPVPPDEAVETQDWPSGVRPLYVNTFGITPYNDNLMGLLLNPPESIFVSDIPTIGGASFPNPYYVAGSYPVTGFRCQMPGVDDSDRNPLTKPVTGEYQIIIPSDTMQFTKP